MLKRKNIVIIMLIIPLYIYLKLGNAFLPIEELGVSSAIGGDIAEDGSNGIKYVISLLINNYESKDQIQSQILTGVEQNFPENREARQKKLNKRFITGLEKNLVLSEEYSKYGIRTFIDIYFKNKQANDNIYLSVCKGKPEEIFKLEIPGYPNAGDYLEGIIDHLNDYSFAPKNYKLIDVYVRMDAEGRSLVLPYVEIRENKPEVTGMAIFKGDKMVRKLDFETSKIMNLLREDDLRGMITLQRNSSSYLTYYGKTTRKVSCEKVDDQFVFTINLSLKGEIISNTLYSDPLGDKKLKKEVENELSRYTENLCYDFIDKMQNEYNLDCLNLGFIAAAKFGRNTGVDWDEVISKSKIKVNVKTVINEGGRGDY